MKNIKLIEIIKLLEPVYITHRQNILSSIAYQIPGACKVFQKINTSQHI